MRNILANQTSYKLPLFSSFLLSHQTGVNNCQISINVPNTVLINNICGDMFEHQINFTYSLGCPKFTCIQSYCIFKLSIVILTI